MRARVADGDYDGVKMKPAKQAKPWR